MPSLVRKQPGIFWTFSGDRLVFRAKVEMVDGRAAVSADLFKVRI